MDVTPSHLGRRPFFCSSYGDRTTTLKLGRVPLFTRELVYSQNQIINYTRYFIDLKLIGNHICSGTFACETGVCLINPAKIAMQTGCCGTLCSNNDWPCMNEQLMKVGCFHCALAGRSVEHNPDLQVYDRTGFTNLFTAIHAVRVCGPKNEHRV